jgi:hypothetical protein
VKLTMHLYIVQRLKMRAVTSLIKFHAMEPYGVGGIAPRILNIDGGEWPASMSSGYILRVGAPPS